MPIELRPHQEAALDRMHNGCILYGDVGVGKTITSLGYYFAKACGGTINKWGSMTKPMDVYVITTAKVRDSKSFELQAAEYGVFAKRELSMHNVKITVDSWNNVTKHKEVKDAFFIFDEQRVVGYGAWSKAFIEIAKHNQWIMLSATPGDTWLDYIPVFIANGWYRNKTDFTDQHVIWTPRVKYPKVQRYLKTAVLVRRRNEVLVHMPFTRTTTRHSTYVTCSYNETYFRKVVEKKWHVYEERPLRDASEMFSVARKVVNSDASRIAALREILERHSRVIVFYNFDYELEMLRSLGSEMMTPTTSSETSNEGLSSPCKKDCELEALRSLGSSSQSPTTLKVEKKSLTPSSTTTPSSSSSSETPRSRPLGLEYRDSLPPASTTTHSTDCTGHWTVDQGAGETWMSCEEYERAISISSSGRQRLASASSDGTVTTLSPESGSDLILSPMTAAASSADGTTQSKSSLVVAEWNGHKHEPVPTSERWVYLVQYRAGAEGWDCITTNAMVFYSQTYSYRDWHQAHGRIDRLNTLYKDLYYYNLWSDTAIDKAIRRAKQAKKSFNERDLDLGWAKTA